MTDRQEELLIRKKILGALLTDARLSSGKSVEECAELVGTGQDAYQSFETGDNTPTLPQLEALSFFFYVPIEHFWGNQTLAVERKEDDIRNTIEQMTAIRDKVIGATLRSLRDEMQTSLEELAEQTGISAEQLEAYEMGNASVPIHELQSLAVPLRATLEDLVDYHGAIGNWLRLQSEFSQFAELPDDIREFVLRPINRSYVELAIHLSGLSVHRLRNIAEGLLEITY